MAGKRQMPPVWEDSAHEYADGAEVAKVATAETRLDELRALRDVMARHIDNPNTLARDLAAIARQFRELSKEIEDLEADEAERAESEVLSGRATDAAWSPDFV